LINLKFQGPLKIPKGFKNPAIKDYGRPIKRGKNPTKGIPHGQTRAKLLPHKTLKDP